MGMWRVLYKRIYSQNACEYQCWPWVACKYSAVEREIWWYIAMAVSYNVTISLLEGKTDCPRNSKTINPSKDCDKKCFQKPGQKPNEKTGLYSLISLKKIKAKNSPIFVRFSVN